MSLLYEEQTGLLRRCFFDVQNEVGLGKQERAYQRGCELWLEENGVPYKAKPAHHVRLHGETAHTLFPDLVVWDTITVELKAVRRKLRSSDLVQVLNYLKYRGDKLGLLVNMGLTRVEVERVPYDQRQYELEEDWEYWTDEISGRDREVGVEVREALRDIFNAHGVGYGEDVTADLVASALRHRRLSSVVSPTSRAFYHGTLVDESPLDCILVEDCLVLVWSSLFDRNDINTGRGRSYLRSLSKQWGIAANFGKTTLQLTGLRTPL